MVGNPWIPLAGQTIFPAPPFVGDHLIRFSPKPFSLVWCSPAPPAPPLGSLPTPFHAGFTSLFWPLRSSSKMTGQAGTFSPKSSRPFFGDTPSVVSPVTPSASAGQSTGRRLQIRCLSACNLTSFRVTVFGWKASFTLSKDQPGSSYVSPC